MNNKIEVFVCSHCGAEDSSFVPSGAGYMGIKPKKEGNVICFNCKKEVFKDIVLMDEGKPMTLTEYSELLKYINENHSFKKGMGKMVKYISHTFDFRTLMISRVDIDGKIFSITNENSHKNLKKWIMDYLKK